MRDYQCKLTVPCSLWICFCLLGHSTGMLTKNWKKWKKTVDGNAFYHRSFQYINLNVYQFKEKTLICKEVYPFIL